MEKLLTEIQIYNEDVVFTKDQHDEILEKIDTFTNAMVGKGQSSEHYTKNRRASAPTKDIANGKYAEFAVARFLHTHLNFPLPDVDLEIRKGRKKGWSFDLQIDTMGVHVKSCDSKSVAYVKDYSWTFQYANWNGKGGTDQLFLHPELTDPVFFVYVNTLFDPTVKIMASGPWNIILPKLADPIARKFIGLKKCLYYKDLI